MAIFTVASLASGLAATALALELFRAMQGVGGAALFATATPLLRAEFSGAALSRSLGAFGATLGGASAIGPLVGGILTDTWGWRSIFIVNLPFGIGAFVLGMARLRESRNPAGGRPDWLGTAMIIVSLVALISAFIRGTALGWSSPAIVALFGIAAVAGACFVTYELHIAPAPMADLRLFARRSFAVTGLVAFAISAAVIGTITYLSLYVQNTLVYSPVQGGLRLLPMFVASVAMAFLTGRLIGKVAMRMLLGVAMAFAAAGLVSMAHLTDTSSWQVLIPGLILAGAGLGITSTALASAALSAVEPARAGMAAGLTNTLRQVGTATGVAVFGALYTSRVSTATLHDLAVVPAPKEALHRLAAAVASGAGTRVTALVPPGARAAVAHAARAGTASGLNDILLAAAAFAALGAIVGFAYGPDSAKMMANAPERASTAGSLKLVRGSVVLGQRRWRGFRVNVDGGSLEGAAHLCRAGLGARGNADLGMTPPMRRSGDSPCRRQGDDPPIPPRAGRSAQRARPWPHTTSNRSRDGLQRATRQTSRTRIGHSGERAGSGC